MNEKNFFALKWDRVAKNSHFLGLACQYLSYIYCPNLSCNGVYLLVFELHTELWNHSCCILTTRFHSRHSPWCRCSPCSCAGERSHGSFPYYDPSHGQQPEVRRNVLTSYNVFQNINVLIFKMVLMLPCLKLVLCSSTHSDWLHNRKCRRVHRHMQFPLSQSSLNHGRRTHTDWCPLQSWWHAGADYRCLSRHANNFQGGQLVSPRSREFFFNDQLSMRLLVWVSLDTLPLVWSVSLVMDDKIRFVHEWE